jgi:hypothetical protein
MTPDIGLGLSTGTRLRARLESAASTAVRAPVLAVIEYTYEREGQIIVPAGAKAVRPCLPKMPFAVEKL